MRSGAATTNAPAATALDAPDRARVVELRGRVHVSVAQRAHAQRTYTDARAEGEVDGRRRTTAVRAAGGAGRREERLGVLLLAVAVCVVVVSDLDLVRPLRLRDRARIQPAVHPPRELLLLLTMLVLLRLMLVVVRLVLVVVLVEGGVHGQGVRGAVRVSVRLVHRVHACAERGVARHAVEPECGAPAVAAREAHLLLLLLLLLLGETRGDVLERDVVVVVRRVVDVVVADLAEVTSTGSNSRDVLLLVALHALVLLVLLAAHDELIRTALLLAHLPQPRRRPPPLPSSLPSLGALGARIHQRKELRRARRLLDAREARAVAPLVELAAERVALAAQQPQLARGEQPLPPVRVHERDAGVDDRGLGRPAHGREVREQRGEVLEVQEVFSAQDLIVKRIGGKAHEESPVESLAALALDGVVGRAALSGVGATAGFALGRRSRGRGRVPVRIRGRRRFLKEANHITKRDQYGTQKNQIKSEDRGCRTEHARYRSRRW